MSTPDAMTARMFDLYRAVSGEDAPDEASAVAFTYGYYVGLAERARADGAYDTLAKIDEVIKYANIFGATRMADKVRTEAQLQAGYNIPRHSHS